ncbi:heparin-binding hemagglutinin [Nocardia sp. CDC160]|uniref:heparin-binding hemagglutinin n=1 Tax=Nocardia sp. CDC160 TaxID=3112166 RepID=UPI002DBADEB3|nr:heparin-binding hemagglutinin [Nocardia sp. CDC160]MEC3919640.1 heparin-binding hemagglutinin [Nocardia sp. CDC160]
MTEPKLTTTVTKPLYATVGAGDALYATVLDVVSQIRERANSADVQGRIEEARERFANLPADVQGQVETLRQRVQALPSELPEDLAELREKATPEELRKLVDQYYHQLLDLYADLAARGEETVEKLRHSEYVESLLNQDAVAAAQDAFDKARAQAEAAFEKAYEQVGPYIGLTGKEEAPAEDAVDAEVVDVTTETAPVEDEAPVKKAAPAKKAPAKKAPAKKAAPAAKK